MSQVNESWRHIQVTVSLKDGATQVLSAMMHMVELANQVILHVKADDNLNSIANEAMIENRGLSSLPYGFSLQVDGGSN